jgi:enolase
VLLDAAAMKNYQDYGTEIVSLSEEFQIEIVKETVARFEVFAAEDPLFKRVFEHQAAFFKTWRTVLKDVAPQITLFDYVD